jgi:hypothetical protein
MNPFAGLNETKTNGGGGVYLTDGRYKLKVNKHLFIDTDNGTRAFIAECVVTETSDAQSHPVGANRSWFQSANKSFKAALKAYCYAACGYDEKDPKHTEALRQLDSRSEAIMLQAIGPKQILSSRELYVDVITKPQKNDKSKTFTHYNFSPASAPIPIDLLDKGLAAG